MNKKLKDKEVTIHNVVVLPPGVKMTKQGIRGSEGVTKEEDDAMRTLVTSVSAALKQNGVSVDTPFSDEALKDNNDLKYAVADVQRKFDQIAPQLNRKLKDVRKGRFSLGDMVAVLNSKGNADALVFVRAEGVKESAGRALLTNGQFGWRFTTRVVVVDAKNGDVLLVCTGIGGLPKEKTFDKPFRKALASR